MVENKSRPWSSVPNKKLSPVNSLVSNGGVKPFIRLRLLGSNGFVGAIKFAKIADNIIRMIVIKETIATGAWQK
jgi:hypothetical protein